VCSDIVQEYLMRAQESPKPSQGDSASGPLAEEGEGEEDEDLS
jgi:hypothetical protein